MRRYLILLILFTFMFGLLAFTGWAQPFHGPRGRLTEVNAPTVVNLVNQKLKEVQPGEAYLNSRGNVYLLPFLDKEGRTVFQLRIDALNGNILEVGQWPSTTDSVVSPKISKDKITEIAQKIMKEKCLEVGKVYKNPRGIYIAEIKCKKGKAVAMVKSDGKYVW